jgi:hypothetical protein
MKLGVLTLLFGQNPLRALDYLKSLRSGCRTRVGSVREVSSLPNGTVERRAKLQRLRKSVESRHLDPARSVAITRCI